MTAEERREYSRQYYAANPEKWKRTPEEKERRNLLRRDRYAADKEHRDKIKEQVKAYRQRQPLQRKAGMYGMTREDVEMLLDLGCQICHSNPHVDPSVRLHIDHDHKTGITRGVLCQPCNLALGFLNDDPITVMAMFHYIMRASTSGLSGVG